MELSGAEILVHCLKDEGVEYLFGYPGGAVLHIYDALYNQEEVKHILVRHEQAATHAAEPFSAKLTFRSTAASSLALSPSRRAGR